MTRENLRLLQQLEARKGRCFPRGSWGVLNSWGELEMRKSWGFWSLIMARKWHNSPSFRRIRDLPVAVELESWKPTWISQKHTPSHQLLLNTKILGPKWRHTILHHGFLLFWILEGKDEDLSFLHLGKTIVIQLSFDSFCRLDFLVKGHLFGDQD